MEWAIGGFLQKWIVYFASLKIVNFYCQMVRLWHIVVSQNGPSNTSGSACSSRTLSLLHQEVSAISPSFTCKRDVLRAFTNATLDKWPYFPRLCHKRQFGFYPALSLRMFALELLRKLSPHPHCIKRPFIGVLANSTDKMDIHKMKILLFNALALNFIPSNVISLLYFSSNNVCFIIRSLMGLWFFFNFI